MMTIGKVTSTASRIRDDPRYPGPRCGITTSKSTSESSVGAPAAYDPNSTMRCGSNRRAISSANIAIERALAISPHHNRSDSSSEQERRISASAGQIISGGA